MNVYGRYTALADSSDKKASKKERQVKKTRLIRKPTAPQDSPPSSTPSLFSPSADARIKSKLLSGGTAETARA